MLFRAIVVWFGILVLAVLNGGFRDNVLVPRMGETPGRALSSISLSVLILLTTWLTIRWIHPVAVSEAWSVGGLWLAFTLAFEFLAGHFLMKKAWAELLVDYNLVRGRIWVLVLLTTLIAPALVYRWRLVSP